MIRNILVAAVLFSMAALLAAQGGQVTVNKTWIIPQRPENLSLTINTSGCQIMIRPTGQVDLTNCTNADDAAKSFWKAVEQYFPCKAAK